MSVGAPSKLVCREVAAEIVVVVGLTPMVARLRLVELSVAEVVASDPVCDEMATRSSC